MKKIGEVLPLMPKPKFKVKKTVPALSRRQTELIDLAGKLAERTREEAKELGFMSRLLIMVNLPYRDPGMDCKTWSRTNGKVSIDIVSAYKKSKGWIGIPYGTYPRLILIYLITQAVKTKSPILSLGKNFNDFLKCLDLHGGGYQYKQIRKQLERILSAAFSWTYETEEMQSRTNIQVSHQSHLWWSAIEDPRISSSWDSYIKLNTDFFDEIIRHAVPLDFRILSVLKNSPLGLDLYMFISWRVFKIDKPVFISWESLQQQLGGQYHDLKEFSRKCRSHIVRIKAICPNLNIEFVRGRVCLKPSFCQN